MRRQRLAAWLARPEARVAITGASGWIGMAFCDRLLAAGAGPEQLLALASAPRELRIGTRRLQARSLAEPGPVAAGDWLVLHAAIAGPDRASGAGWASARALNDQVLDQALELAGRLRARGFVLVSSGAVHRPAFGGPDRQAYARMKAAHEVVVAQRAAAEGLSVLIPRVFNLAGPFMTQPRAYALGDFILSAAREQRIRIGARGEVRRSFVHVGEMAAVLLDAALGPELPAGPFDVAGPDSVEIEQLARAVAAALGRPELPAERPWPLDGPADLYVGDGSVYQGLLAAAGGAPVPLARMVAETVDWLRSVEPEAFQA